MSKSSININQHFFLFLFLFLKFCFHSSNLIICSVVGFLNVNENFLGFLWSAKQAKQVSKRLAESMSNGENMDNFTVLYTSYPVLGSY